MDLCTVNNVKWYQTKIQQVFCISKQEHIVDMLLKFKPAPDSKSTPKGKSGNF